MPTPPCYWAPQQSIASFNKVVHQPREQTAQQWSGPGIGQQLKKISGGNNMEKSSHSRQQIHMVMWPMKYDLAVFIYCFPIVCTSTTIDSRLTMVKQHLYISKRESLIGWPWWKWVMFQTLKRMSYGLSACFFGQPPFAAVSRLMSQRSVHNLNSHPFVRWLLAAHTW
jgi:hypothetical protein